MIKILHIEDNIFDFKWIKANLEDLTLKEPLEIVQAESLQKAIDLLAAAEFDLILTDLNLPDSNEATTVKTLAEHFPTVPVLVLSGSEDIASVVDSFRSGAKDFFIKRRFHESNLVRAMRSAISGEI